MPSNGRRCDGRGGARLTAAFAQTRTFVMADGLRDGGHSISMKPEGGLMAFEPFGYGNRWQDRLAGGVLKPKEFALSLLFVSVAVVVWRLT